VALFDHPLLRKARQHGALRLLQRLHRVTHRLPVKLREPRRCRVLVIGLYASQVAGLHYVEGTLGINRYRALRVYVEYADAFLVTSGKEYVGLARVTNRL
jgi:hypothetical protein